MLVLLYSKQENLIKMQIPRAYCMSHTVYKLVWRLIGVCVFYASASAGAFFNLWSMIIMGTCCFIGHRKIKETEELNNKIYEVIEILITNKNVDTFLFGSRSEFDSLCHKITTELRDKYPHIKRIFVRAVYEYIDDDYKNCLLEWCEDTYFPEKIKNSGRALYVERNCEMIDKSDFCVFYYDENYLPPRRKYSKKI